MAVGNSTERNVRPKILADSDESGDVSEDFGRELDDSDSFGGYESTIDAEVSKGGNDVASDHKEVESEDRDASHEIKNVSFSALLEAQNALSRKSKRGSDATADQDAKLEALRSRLQEIRADKDARRSSRGSEGIGRGSSKRSALEQTDGVSSRTTKANKHRTGSGWDDEDNSDSAPSEEGAPAKSRSSKHAPASQSSRHQVTRKRNVVDVPKRVIRDPRFDATNYQSQHPNNNSEKAYSFLRDYEKSEIGELKAALKATKSDSEKETLRRKLNSMENRIKSQEAKEREQEVLRKHRKEEREKVEQGKKPFFLKEKDVKERAAVEKFKGMKKKDQTKSIEKRKRRESQKERKRMPEERRVAEGANSLKLRRPCL